jgi:hypothetical protein
LSMKAIFENRTGRHPLCGKRRMLRSCVTGPKPHQSLAASTRHD